MSLLESARRARRASRLLAATPAGRRTEALRRIASELRSNSGAILEASAADLAAARERGLDPAFLDRLALDTARVNAMAAAVEEVASQPDPIGRLTAQEVRPNGLRVARMRTPLGVIAVIYEARPNVTSDAAALALRSGNAIILKGGRDARRSNRAIGDVVGSALAASGLPKDAVTVITDSGRAEIAELLTFDEEIDLVIPRGGEGLIRFVAENSRIPVVKHYKGVCHVFIDASADPEMAEEITVNAKASRPSVCNAVETVLIHSKVAEHMLPRLHRALTDAGVTLHACPKTRLLLADAPGVVAATDDDWASEYLSLDVALRIVDSLDAAIEHIERYGSDHTEAIVTESLSSADEFVRRITSSCVMVNASTRFADGGELGLGAEIGISTSKVHAYGPMGADELTTTRFVVTGTGHVR